MKERGSLRGLSRWVFLGTLVVAPWLYGGTTAWSIELINWLLGVALALWIASLLIDRRLPLVPRSLAVIIALLLLQGWWMVANAHAIYDDDFRLFASINSLWSSGAGSAEYVQSFAWMLRATVLLGAVCLVAELAQRPVWLLRLWFTLAIAGGSIALFGLIQKGTGARMIFWMSAEPWEANTFFATYYYHANAGAFLNLVLPVVAGLTCWVMARETHRISRAFLVTAAMIVTLAVLSNTSRMAQVVGGLLVIGLLATVVRPLLRKALHLEKRTLVVMVVIAGIAILAVGQAAHLNEPLGRWRQFTKQLPVDERWTANHVALGAVGDAGLFGFGPGTFRAIFPHYQAASPEDVHGTWRFLHDDYLQTLLEWGWLGSAMIAALFFGGIGVALRNYFRGKDWAARQRILLPCVMLALVGVALHALVDFPLQILSIQLLVATYLGVCWGSGGWGKVESRKWKVETGRGEDGGWRIEDGPRKPITNDR